MTIRDVILKGTGHYRLLTDNPADSHLGTPTIKRKTWLWDDARLTLPTMMPSLRSSATKAKPN
ncbi:MAG: hypothetical protein E7H36_08450 [Bifidobacterium dentium]|nr:hypothetical protein [Bifidobacterium dentium]